MKAIGFKTDVLKDSEYYSMVDDLIGNEVVNRMREYVQHGNTSTFQHCLNVSYYNYKICKALGLDARAGARAGLLHDLFLYDWHTYRPAQGERLHGFTHAARALKNASALFALSERESDIIKNHMWPLTLGTLPRYKETFVIVMVDKVCGVMEIVKYRAQEISYTSEILGRYGAHLLSRVFGRKRPLR